MKTYYSTELTEPTKNIILKLKNLSWRHVLLIVSRKRENLTLNCSFCLLHVIVSMPRVIIHDDFKKYGKTNCSHCGKCKLYKVKILLIFKNFYFLKHMYVQTIYFTKKKHINCFQKQIVCRACVI